MFTRKYIFETNKTRYARYLKNIFFFSFLGFLAYFIVCVYLVFNAEEMNKEAENAFFKKPPDLIVVFTGQTGRIPFALQKAKEYKQPKVFITGVYSKNTVTTLVPADDELLNPDFLEIDYLARNTVENVLSTYRYLRSLEATKRILVISHDYHLARSRMIFNKLRSSDDDYEFHFMGVKSDLTDIRAIKIVIVEVFKLVRANAFLLLWDHDMPSNPR